MGRGGRIGSSGVASRPKRYVTPFLPAAAFGSDGPNSPAIGWCPTPTVATGSTIAASRGSGSGPMGGGHAVNGRSPSRSSIAAAKERPRAPQIAVEVSEGAASGEKGGGRDLEHPSVTGSGRVMRGGPNGHGLTAGHAKRRVKHAPTVSTASSTASRR